MNRLIKYLCIVIALFTGCSKNSNFNSDTNVTKLKKQSTPDSILIGDNYYTENDLTYYSPEFLKYLCNEILARKGNIFKDSCLQMYFDNQDWYVPSDSKIVLNDMEIKWINIINKIENEYKPQNRYKVITKFIFENKPIFYIYSYRIKNNDENRQFHRVAYLYLLGESKKWILNCESIPPEYIINFSIDKIKCDDESFPISPEQIKIVNFDSTCLNGERPELIIRLYGPSSDDEHNIIGFNNSGKLERLVYSVYMENYFKISDSIIRIISLDRCDRIGTEFCHNEYNFNTITKVMTKISKEEYKHSKHCRTLDDSVKLYITPSAAKNKYSDSVSYIIPPHSNVTISHFLDKRLTYQIEYKKYSGWITYEDLHKFDNISFAD